MKVTWHLATSADGDGSGNGIHHHRHRRSTSNRAYILLVGTQQLEITLIL